MRSAMAAKARLESARGGPAPTGRRVCLGLAALVGLSVSPSWALASGPSDGAVIARAVHEAAVRFELSPQLIEAVIQVESGGRAGAVSLKGAMGLMQLMPVTWAVLARDLGLGSDPFEPRANVLAGSAYLRQMLDRFGAPGFLAAYNAGPGRYLRFLRSGAPLPAETISYMKRVLGLVDARSVRGSAATRPLDWKRSRLFIGLPTGDNGSAGPDQHGSSVGLWP